MPGGRIPLVLLGSLVMTGIGQTLLYALLPLTARQMGLSGYQASAVFALSSLFWSAFSPIWGRVADRSRGVWVLALGMLGQAASNLAVGAVIVAALRGVISHAWVFPLLLVLRGINGVLGSAVLPSAQGMALRAAPGRARIALIGTVATSWNIGTMSGPGFAAVLAGFGAGAPLFVSAGLAVLAAGIVMAGAGRAGEQPAGLASPGRGVMRMVRRRIWPFMAMGLAIGTANSIVAQVTGFYVQDRLGLSVHMAHIIVGLGLSIVAASSVAGQTMAIRLQPAALALLRGGAALVAAAAGLMAAIPNIWVLVPGLSAVGIGLGCAGLGVSTAASLMIRSGQQGAVAGAMASASSLGAIFSALLVMPFYERSAQFPYLVVVALCAGVTAASLWAPRPPGPAAHAD